jgi:hypothetical protein
MRPAGDGCQCDACQGGQEHGERAAHRAMNMVMAQLDERQRRLYAAAEAQRRGRGGIKAVRQITGMSYRAVRHGLDELSGQVAPPPAGRVREVGGGRKRTEEAQPGIDEALESLVEAETAGDPEGHGRWVRASLRELERALSDQGYSVSHQTVSRMLKDMKYALRVNAKRKTGPSHPDRDRQFQHIKDQVATFRAAGDPVISVDTKKRNSSVTSGTRARRGADTPTP